jgi:phosphoribosylglycinamide formyltransferase 1
MKNLVILISGRGSNMEAIVSAAIPGVRVAAVISNRPGAAGLDYARARGIETRVVDHRPYADRESFDAALSAEIDRFAPDLVVLAGFMRILTPDFTRRYAQRMINIHPSLLPAFTGLDTHRRAIEAGCRLAGCTVHFVTAELDHGPIVAQAAVPVRQDDTAETLARRVLAAEHRLYPRAVRWFAEDRLRLVDGRVCIDDADGEADAMLIAPEV